MSFLGEKEKEREEKVTIGQRSSVVAQVPSKHRTPPLLQRHSCSLEAQIPLVH
jgi:hypothetical protein